MKIVSWNIRGCNHPRKIKTLSRKIEHENPEILFLQETKCSYETLMKVGQQIWKGSSVMETYAEGIGGEGDFHPMKAEGDGSLGMESQSLLLDDRIQDFRIWDHWDGGQHIWAE